MALVCLELSTPCEMELRDCPPPHKKVELCLSPALHPCVLRWNRQRNFVTDLRNFVGGIPRTPQQCWAPAGVAPETPPTTLLWGAGVCLRSSISHGGVHHPGSLTGACFVRVSGRRGCQAMFFGACSAGNRGVLRASLGQTRKAGHVCWCVQRRDTDGVQRLARRKTTQKRWGLGGHGGTWCVGL